MDTKMPDYKNIGKIVWIAAMKGTHPFITVIKTTLYLNVSLFRELFLFWLCTVLSYDGLRGLVRHWPAVHNQNMQRFFNGILKRGGYMENWT